MRAGHHHRAQEGLRVRPITHHDHYEKTIGDLSIKSFGGGHPRQTTLSVCGEQFLVTVEECRDLRYMLDQLIEGLDNDLRLRMRSPGTNT